MYKYLVIVTKDKEVIIKKSMECTYEGSLRDMARFINMSCIAESVEFKAIAESYEEGERRANAYIERTSKSILNSLRVFYRYIRTKFTMVL